MAVNKRLIGAGATASSAITPSENFKVVTYTGTGSSQAITGVGFQPDKVVIKKRDGADDWAVFDSNRGANFLSWNNTNAQSSFTFSFDSDGFTVPSTSGMTNGSGNEYVAYCWKANGGTTSSNTDGSVTSTVQANTQAGFSIVEWTGQSSQHSIGHSLGVKPSMVFFKRTDAANDWLFYYDVVDGSLDYAYLNQSTAGANSSRTLWTSSVFYHQGVGDYIGYAFTPVESFSKFGTYTGNGSANGPIIETGFEPAFLMIKRTDTADSWVIHDNKRDLVNPRKKYLLANGSNAEAADLDGIDFLSNGFQLKDDYAYYNASSGTYIYMAFATDPDTEAPTLASSFNVQTYTGTGAARSVTGFGFSPNLIWGKNRDANEPHWIYDTSRGPNKLLESNSTIASTTVSSRLTGFESDGFTIGGNDGSINGSGVDYVAWAWKADDNEPTINENGSIDSIVSANANAGFSIVKYEGDGSTSKTVGHGLSSAPEMVIVKRLDSSADWYVWATPVMSITGSTSDYIVLNSSAAKVTAASVTNLWGGNVPSATTIGVGDSSGSNASGGDYIAYCFHSVSGFSKFGTYTGTGSDGNAVTTGFQPDFLMVKRSDSTGGWLMFDSARSGSNPIDDRIEANNNQAEQLNSGSKYVDFNSNDFEANGSDSELNASGGTYIYMAYKMNPAPVVAEGKYSFLIVAGGASGGAFYGGGGGAGGLRTSFGSSSGGGASAMSEETLSSGTYTITVGAGGTSVLSSTYGRGNDGNTSSITGNSSLSTVGGGAGGTYVTNTTTLTGNSGGSGGGGGTLHQTSPYTSAGGAGTANQGYAGADGGAGSFNGTVGPGGGGGSAAVGGASSGGYRVGGNGGAGLAVSITGSSSFYAAGGAGGGEGGAGTGGVAGTSSGTAGATNTGSGGGGCGNSGSSSRSSGAGGSGVVILRMRTSDYSGTTTGSPTVTVLGDETILTYTGSGTYVHS
jgi:hypothetical protein